MYEYIALVLIIYQLICLVGRVFTNGPGDLGLRTLKMVLDTSFLNNQQYKVYIKGKVEQWCSALLYTLG